MADSRFTRRKPGAKLDPDSVRRVRLDALTEVPESESAAAHGVANRTIRRAVLRETWGDV